MPSQVIDMNCPTRPVALLFALVAACPGQASAQAQSLPSPLGLHDVIRIAAERRAEIEGARARVRAGQERMIIVSALADPMVSPSLDHLPFTLEGADFSVTFEQQLPLSGIRAHRRASALADVNLRRAIANRTALDLGAEAANAYLMLADRRRTAALMAEQMTFAREVVSAANARYASGTAPQSDVLRAEVEVARLEAAGRSLAGEVRAAEAMLNTSLGFDADRSVPEQRLPALAQPIPAWSAVKSQVMSRPELAGGAAEVARAEADIQVMRDMFRPMATIRTGPSYTMAEGAGWMAMIGFSVPIWRSKLHAGVAEAQAMRTMAEADLRAMARMIQGEAAVALGQLQATGDRRTALTTDVLPRAQFAVESAVASYAAGQLPLVSVIDAIQALRLVQSEVVAADTQLGLAWTRLGRAVGSYEAIVQ